MDSVEITNRRWTEEEFLGEREKVLNQWPTGREVTLEDAVAYLCRLPPEKSLPLRISQAAEQGETLVQPRGGVPLVEDQIRLLKLFTESGADLLPTTVDSYTRHLRYHEAEEGVKGSSTSGKSLLNGFPPVNHGLKECRRIVEAMPLPLEARSASHDCRLSYEMMFAAGYTAATAGGIVFAVGYEKNVPFSTSIRNWQYVDRLVGYYEEHGIPISLEHYLPISTLVPHCLSLTCAILDSLIAVEQGVRHLTLGFGQQGCLLQDVVALQLLPELCGKYLERCGYPRVRLTTVLSQWMGGFPQDEGKAFGVICLGAATAALGGATYVINKSPHEALGVPTPEANVAGIMASKQVIHMLQNSRFPVSEEVEEEKEIMRLETEAILDRVLDLGGGDPAVGAVRAFAAGVIDIPFSPNRGNANKVLPVRDRSGAIRFLDHGHLPFPDRVVRFHQRKVEERARTEKRPADYEMLIADVLFISDGLRIGTPRAR